VGRGRAWAQPAAEPEAQGAFASGEPWQGYDHRGGCDPGCGYDRERGLRRDPGSWEGDGDSGGADAVATVEQKANDLLAQVDAYRDLSSSLAVEET
jgi:hypothetical protein